MPTMSLFGIPNAHTYPDPAYHHYYTSDMLAAVSTAISTHPLNNYHIIARLAHRPDSCPALPAEPSRLHQPPRQRPSSAPPIPFIKPAERATPSPRIQFTYRQHIHRCPPTIIPASPTHYTYPIYPPSLAAPRPATPPPIPPKPARKPPKWAPTPSGGTFAAISANPRAHRQLGPAKARQSWKWSFCQLPGASLLRAVLRYRTFDNWSKSVKLQKDGDSFQKTVDIPASSTNAKIHYKFVADGDWKHDPTGNTETDHEGNVNNVIHPQDLQPSLSSAAMSSTGPEATTAALAGKQPLEHEKDLPGAFPETPLETPAAADAQNEQTFSVNPIPASEGAGNPISLAAGEKVPEPSSIHTNTINSTVHDDPELKAKDTEQTITAVPIPAAAGPANPVTLKPGEEVPHPSTLTGNTIVSNVKLDKESYEKSDSGAPQLPPISPTTEKEANGFKPVFGGLGGLGGIGPGSTPAFIPESSLPMGDNAVSDVGPTISSVAPQSTTSALAGQQPIEPRGVPQVVEDSQEKVNAAPEAAANPEAVQEKTQLEDELKDKVPAAPAAAESGAVPAVVEESQEKAHAAPEAAANHEAVEEKKQFEDELKQKVPEEPATSESGLLGKSERGVTGAIAGGAVAAGTAAVAGAYALRDKTTETTGTDPVEAVTGSSPKTDAAGLPIEPSTVPHTVEESQEKAHVDPEAAANPEAVVEKSEVEDELKRNVPEQPATSESGLLGNSERGVTGAVAGAVVGGAATVGAAAAATTYAIRQKATETTGTDPVAALPEGVQDSINNMNSKGTTAPAVAPAPPSTLDTSKDATIPQQPALGQGVVIPVEENAPPAASGAAANPEAVLEKKAMEQELKSELKPVEASGEPAPTVTAATTAIAPVTSASGAPQLNEPASVSPISMESDKPSAVPVVAVPVVAAAGAAAGAAGTTAITDKTNEKEVAGSKELNAPAGAPAKTEVQDKLAAPEQQTPLDSRDVSPMSRVATKNHPEGSESAPTVTTGAESEKVPAESKADESTGAESSTASKTVGSRPDASNSTPQKRGSFMDRMKGTPEKSTPESTKTGTSGGESQKKRRSFFGRIKDKLKSTRSVSRTREQVVVGPSDEVAVSDGEDEALVRDGPAPKVKGRADSSFVPNDGAGMAGPVDPSIHDRPVPESAVRPVIAPRASDTPTLVDPVQDEELDQGWLSQAEFAEGDDSGGTNIPDRPALPTIPDGPIPRIGETTNSSDLLAMAPNDLFVDRDGHILLRNEDIDAMLSRLDEEVEVAEQEQKQDGSQQQQLLLLPDGLQWLPPNIELEYDWIGNFAARDEENRPGPPTIQLALRVKRREERAGLSPGGADAAAAAPAGQSGGAQSDPLANAIPCFDVEGVE
ncbi:hypothetical protein Q7P37_001829 [Cladosporium fusiforme]